MPTSSHYSSQGGSQLLKIKKMHKYFRGRHVLKGINVQVNAREVAVIIGSSRFDNSLLLRCVNFLDTIDEGEIWFDGKKITETQTNIGMVNRHFNLFPHKTMLDHVMEAPIIFHHGTRERAVVEGMHALNKVGLREKAFAYPKNLSDSEKQKLAIARVLVLKPKIMLFDYPTAMLHKQSADKVFDVIKILAEEGMTMIVTTDDIDFIRTTAKRILLLEKGVIVEDSPVETFFNKPKTTMGKQFLKNM